MDAREALFTELCALAPEHAQQLGSVLAGYSVCRADTCGALEAGMDITVIQQLLGHEDVRTTQIYAGISQQAVRRAYDRFVT